MLNRYKVCIVSLFLFTIFMCISLGYKIASLETQLANKEDIIKEQMGAIHLLEISNIGYEQYIQGKLLDGDIIEIETIDR